MNLMDRYLEQTTFASYEDFAQNLRILVPDNFNFAYDIIDEYARLEPDRLALVWCDDHGGDRRFTFMELKRTVRRTSSGMLKRQVLLLPPWKPLYWWVVPGLAGWITTRKRQMSPHPGPDPPVCPTLPMTIP